VIKGIHRYLDLVVACGILGTMVPSRIPVR
jgi:hypothetical protein